MKGFWLSRAGHRLKEQYGKNLWRLTVAQVASVAVSDLLAGTGDRMAGVYEFRCDEGLYLEITGKKSFTWLGQLKPGGIFQTLGALTMPEIEQLQEDELDFCGKRYAEDISNMNALELYRREEPNETFNQLMNDIYGEELAQQLPAIKNSERQAALLESKEFTDVVKEFTRDLSQAIHARNQLMGWYDQPREVGTLLMLIVSEISEAMEGERRDKPDDHLPNRRMAEVELADAIIRILDFAAYRGYDVAGAMVEKLEYNRTRQDHKREVRAAEGGKKF